MYFHDVKVHTIAVPHDLIKISKSENITDKQSSHFYRSLSDIYKVRQHFIYPLIPLLDSTVVTVAQWITKQSQVSCKKIHSKEQLYYIKLLKSHLFAKLEMTSHVTFQYIFQMNSTRIVMPHNLLHY